MLLKACEAIKYKVGKGLGGGLVDQLSELENNKEYLYQNMKNNEDNSKDDWLREDFESENSNIEATSSNTSSKWAKEKLVQIFKGEVPIF